MHNRVTSVLAILLVACFGLSIVACGGGDEKKDTKKKRTRKTVEKTESTDTSSGGPAGGKIDLANAGTITGTMKYGGAKPAKKMLDNSKDKWCKEQGTIEDESLVVGDNGGLRDVFVYVDGLDAVASQFPAPTAAVKIVQRGCQYRPHVFGIQVDQDLEIVNADNTSHNYHFIGRANEEINKTQPKPTTNVEVFEAAEMGASLSCDIHPWMSAVVHIMDHPCFAVSAADGTFTIKNVPPGTYTVRFVHANAKSASASASVTVSAKGTASIGEVTFN